jgi:hypothetical protein
LTKLGNVLTSYNGTNTIVTAEATEVDEAENNSVDVDEEDIDGLDVDESDMDESEKRKKKAHHHHHKSKKRLPLSDSHDSDHRM